MKSKEKYLTSLADIKVKIVDEKGFVVGDNTMLVLGLQYGTLYDKNAYKGKRKEKE
mgnify:FL=1|jgi:hypothetical protein|tara:strand:+ start:408 stop:575 length:168 start_codon:yes stop_codon:yes gene_type:complete